MAGITPIKVLFVCVHNAARSRMAETLLKSMGGDRFLVTSAGFEPREVNPLVVEALAEVGLEPASTGVQPSVFDLFKEGRRFDYVISVCDDAQGERCPLFPGITQRVSWSFADPSTFTGAHDEKVRRTAEVRAAIGERIASWLAELRESGRLS